MRWLFHIATASAWNDFRAGGREAYAPASLASEGFIHASYRDGVVESARLYFASGAELVVLCIDPRKLDVRVDEVHTPRGPMPHIAGAIPQAAIDSVWSLADMARAPDEIG